MLLKYCLAVATAIGVVAAQTYSAGGSYPDSGKSYAPAKEYSAPASYPTQTDSYSPPYSAPSGKEYAPAGKDYSSPAEYSAHPTPVYSSYGSTGQYSGNSEHSAELGDLTRRVADRAHNDKAVNITLKAISRKIPINTKFRESFEGELFPAIQEELAGVDDRIADYTQQIQEISDVPNLVRDVFAGIKRLEDKIKKIRQDREGILDAIYKLQDGQSDVFRSYDVLEGRVEAQGETIGEVEEIDGSNSARVDAIIKNLKKAVDIVNLERAQFFTLYLNDKETTANFTYDVPFERDPSVAYGIISADHTKIVSASYDSGSYGTGGSYGSGYDNNTSEYISVKVELTTDVNGGTVTLVDDSKGWKTTFVIVRITAFIKDNSILEYEEAEGEEEEEEEEEYTTTATTDAYPEDR